MGTMEIPAGTPSLLHTLLKEIAADPTLLSKYTNDPSVYRHIVEVAEAVSQRPFKRSLVKDVAQKRLYDVLYEVIEKEYEVSEEEPSSDQKTLAARKEARDQNRILNSAIGRALENALTGELKDFPPVQALREELRKRIIEALIPQQP
jgi:hypothetical protein